MWVTIFSMPPPLSIEQKHIRISLGVVATICIFVIVTAGAAAAWAQNVTNHLSNVDKTLDEMNAVMKDVRNLNVIQERTVRMEERLQHLEEWRLQEAESLPRSGSSRP